MCYFEKDIPSFYIFCNVKLSNPIPLFYKKGLKRMNLLGFYLGGHDSNVSLAGENGQVQYFKAERITQHKHKRATLQWVRDICTEQNFTPDLVCFSDGNRNQLGCCEKGTLFQKTTAIEALFPVDTYVIDHHYGHILSGFMEVDSHCSYGVSIDGRGDWDVKCSIFKHCFDLDKVTTIYDSDRQSFCLMFNKIGGFMGLSGGELDFAGKIMGLHGYGTVDHEYIKNHTTQYYLQNPMTLLEEDYLGYPLSSLYQENHTLFLHWLASIHTLLGNFIFRLFQEHIPPEAEVLYSGGCAQNTIYNALLKDQFPNLQIPPHCYDGGISLGCLKFLSLLHQIQLEIPQYPFCQETEDVGYAGEETIAKASELLTKGKILGWCQGKGELGPRALGHRSILMDPSHPHGKDLLNERVKKRESWRPYAATVLLENLSKLSPISYPCPHMLHAVPVHPKYHSMMQSIVHVDKSCRFQSLRDTPENRSFYQLLQRFQDKTGVMGLLNTSLNLGGKPIVSGRKEALDLFASMDLDGICIGDTLLTKD